MAPVAGRPFIEHLMDHWISQGVGRFFLSVGHMAHVIQDRLGPAYGGCPIEYVVEAEPLGTGGALLLAAQRLKAGSPFLVLNGDTYCDVDLQAAWKRHQDFEASLSMILAPHPGTPRFESIECDGLGRVLSLRPRGSGAGGRINAGVYLFDSTAVLDGEGLRSCSLEQDLLPTWLSAGLKIGGVPHNGYFIDIGLPEDYAAANGRFLAKGE